jgi:hypothetical protein
MSLCLSLCVQLSLSPSYLQCFSFFLLSWSGCEGNCMCVFEFACICVWVGARVCLSVLVYYVCVQ